MLYVAGKFQAIILPLLLAILLLVESSQSLRSSAMRLEIIQPEAKFLRNIDRIIT